MAANAVLDSWEDLDTSEGGEVNQEALEKVRELKVLLFMVNIVQFVYEKVIFICYEVICTLLFYF